MRVVLIGIAVLALAACGRSGTKQVVPVWVQKANALCAPIDRQFKTSDELFDSAAWFSKFEHEARGLERLGFFKRVPAAAFDMARVARSNPGFGTEKLDFALRHVRRDARRAGVHCSFGAVPLVQA